MTTQDRVENELMEKKLKCVNLLLSCPLSRNAPGCPFGRVREEESVVTRVNWVKSLDETGVMRLLAEHAKCLSKPVILRPIPS